MDILQCFSQRSRVKNIAPNELRGFMDDWPQLIHISSETPQDERLTFE
jgi:hypothetical protein